MRVARNGTLAYVPADSLVRRLVSVARDGAAFPLDLPPGNLQTPRLSPDRRRVLVTDSAGVLAAWDLERRLRAELTTPAPVTRPTLDRLGRNRRPPDSGVRATLRVTRSPVASLGGHRYQARWSADGREIYYRDGTSIMAVPFDGSGDEPVMGTALFRDDYEYGPGLTIANYDATPDGRFLMLRRESHGGQLRVVLNWTEELKQIIARGGVR